MKGDHWLIVLVEKQKSSISVYHRFYFRCYSIGKNTDQIIILDDGKVHRIGTHAELLADDPIYQEIYASQMKGGDENGSESL